MIKISKLADYATVIMDFLASQQSHRYSAALIATAVHISTPTVSKILKLLHEAQLVNSERGVNGGYQLSRPPEEISLTAIIAAIDGQPAMTECSKGDICSLNNVCHLRGNWQFINRLIVSMLNNVSVADMSRPLGQVQEKVKLRYHACDSMTQD